VTFFSEANEDSRTVTPDSVSTGPLVGFFESFETSVNTQMRTSAQFGIEYFMQDLDWKQTKAMMDAGVEDAPQLILGLEDRKPGEGAVSVAQYLRKDSGYYEDFVPERSGAYLDVAKRYSGREISPEFEERLQAYDARILAIRKDRPDLPLMSSREMFDNVRQSAQDVERKAATDRRSWGGTAGNFLGGAAASLHPGTDPLNFYSAGVGGAGKTAFQRILVQGGVQGGVEAINQITGVQEERDLLGLSTGFADAAGRVGMAAVGGAAFQGAGEGLRAGFRALRRPAAPDAAPDPLRELAADRQPSARPDPANLKEEAQAARLEQDGRSYIDMIADEMPLSGLRAGRQRDIMDFADMTRQLEEWDGPSPAAAGPRTQNVAMPGEAPKVVVDVSRAVDGNARYQAAKQADPVAMTKYDKLVDRANTFRRWLAELSDGQDADVARTLDAITKREADLQSRLRAAKGKGPKAKIRQELRDAVTDREQVLKLSGARETAQVAQVRRDLAKNDEAMRDLAPVVSRAYARADGKWGDDVAEMDAVFDAYRSGRAEPDMPPSGVPDVDVLMSLVDRAPVLRAADRVEPGATSAITAQRVIAENAKVLDEALATYRSQIGGLLGDADGGKLTIQGREYEFDIDADKMYIPHEDGVGGREVTIREYLTEAKKSEDELEAVSTCSMR
jgi:hypothetical protein